MQKQTKKIGSITLNKIKIVSWTSLGFTLNSTQPWLIWEAPNWPMSSWTLHNNLCLMLQWIFLKKCFSKGCPQLIVTFVKTFLPNQISLNLDKMCLIKLCPKNLELFKSFHWTQNKNATWEFWKYLLLIDKHLLWFDWTFHSHHTQICLRLESMFFYDLSQL